MTTYESDIKIIPQSQEYVFNLISNLSNLEKVQQARIEGSEKAAEYFKDIQFDNDSVQFSVVGIGKVGFRIIEREPFKTIKLESENSPVPANGWIQLVEISPESCKMKLTIKTEMPAMIKMMVDAKMKKGINTIADAIVAAVSSGEQLAASSERR